jgi:hypothetical protein
MKTFFTGLVLSLILTHSLAAQPATISVFDANFRAALVAARDSNNVPYGITDNGNGTVQVPDIAAVTVLSIPNRNIARLFEIRFFTSLVRLDCSRNRLNGLNLNDNRVLEVLNCSRNTLGEFNVDSCFVLRELDCSNNLIGTLNLLNNRNLVTLICNDSFLNFILDLRGCFRLRFLSCESNLLSSIDLTNSFLLTEMNCSNNRLVSLDLTNCFGLRRLNCRSNLLASLNVGVRWALETLDCSSNQLTALVVSSNSFLQSLSCSSNRIRTLDLRANTALASVSCDRNLISMMSLNVFNNLSLTQLNSAQNRIPIILTSPTTPTISEPDPITQVAIFRSDTTSATLTPFLTGGFILGNTGAILNFTNNGNAAGTLTASAGTNPSIVGALPSGVLLISPEKFWRIEQSGLNNVVANLILDLTPIPGVSNFNTLRVLRRANVSSEWVDVASIPGVSVQYLQPFLIINGLTSFGEFAIGSTGDNQLPVELTSFTGVLSGKSVDLTWTTATELNNAGFAIERSLVTDNASSALWTSLGFVRGHGTTSNAQTYTYRDETAVGKVRYRLKQTDYDGTVAYSPVVEVQAVMPQRFSLAQNFPNPFNPSTRITYQLPISSDVRLDIFDMLGRRVTTLVNERQPAGAYSVNFNATSISGGGSLASGVYFYKLQSGTFIETKKMMLVK